MVLYTLCANISRCYPVGCFNILLCGLEAWKLMPSVSAVTPAPKGWYFLLRRHPHCQCNRFARPVAAYAAYNAAIPINGRLVMLSFAKLPNNKLNGCTVCRKICFRINCNRLRANLQYNFKIVFVICTHINEHFLRNHWYFACFSFQITSYAPFFSLLFV